MLKNLSSSWNVELVKESFIKEDADLILSLPCASSNVLVGFEFTGFVVEVLWRIKVPSKVKSLVWRACHNWVPSYVNLAKHQMKVDYIVPLCSKNPESTIHALCSEEMGWFMPQIQFKMLILSLGLIIYGGCGDIAYCRLGHEKWTTIETGGLTFFDITYFKGTLYAIDCKGRIIAYDLRESSGELLVISREGVSIHPITEGSDDNYTYGTYEFRVFKVDIISTMTITWMEIKDLGNIALFLGYNTSMSIEASNFYKPNCIYFTDDCMGSYWEDEKGGGKDMGIYNLHDGSITSVPFKGDPYSPINPAM
ncbi:hypothetical protein EZV62_018503 [Acer yangbiense]|uniref:DUF295 domain-containing protein n=1 Tax=Acer yangbiense TaxID=1000413 RepID=A0A5C7HJI8_9ROSI|nr:hypothetical protein EZV62_018503 [Acer yangbiense]